MGDTREWYYLNAENAHTGPVHAAQLQGAHPPSPSPAARRVPRPYPPAHQGGLHCATLTPAAAAIDHRFPASTLTAAASTTARCGNRLRKGALGWSSSGTRVVERARGCSLGRAEQTTNNKHFTVDPLYSPETHPQARALGLHAALLSLGGKATEGGLLPVVSQPTVRAPAWAALVAGTSRCV